MSNFKNEEEYLKHKNKENECYIKGCTEHQTDNEYICETHLEDEEIYFHECSQCRLLVPIFLDECDFHGGTTYSVDMKERLLAAVQPVSFKSKLKEEAKEAAAKVATDNFVAMTKSKVIAILNRNGMDNKTTKKIASFIETDLGKAIYTVLLSGLMSALPEKVGPVNTVELASQLRVKAMAEFGDSAMTLFFPAVMQVFSTLALPTEETVEQEEMVEKAAQVVR